MNKNKSNKEKRYFWYKFRENFFNDPKIKYLRNLPDGNSLVIAFQKLMLSSLQTEGYIKLEYLYPSIEEEISILIDEDINLIRLLIPALQKINAIEIYDNGIYIIYLQGNIGSEGSSAERVRRFRERQALLQSNDKMLLCNNKELPSNGNVIDTEGTQPKRQKLLHCNADVTQNENRQF